MADRSNLTMLDYIKRMNYGAWSEKAMALLSTLPWPEEGHVCCDHAKPLVHRFYTIPGKGSWLIGDSDHARVQHEHPDWRPEK